MRHHSGYVYDLEVEHDHNYIANGCLVGNSTAATYSAVFRHFRHLPADGSPPRDDGLLLGLTGTSRRTDNVGLSAVYEEIAYTITLRELVERGYLAPLRGYLVRSSTSLEHVKIVETADGERDYDARELARVLNTRPRNELVVDATRQLALSSDPPRPTIVFACDIAHTEALAQAFQRAGITAEAVHSQIDRARRLAILDAFRRGDIQVLVNCEILVEGVDLPMTSAIVMARPTRSTILYSQAVGRGMRLSPETGKTDCLVIDLVDASPEHAEGLVTLPSLFGLPPRMDLKGQAAHDVLRQLETAASALETGIDDATLQQIASPDDIPRIFQEFDFWKIAGLPPEISAATQLAWQRLPSGAYTLLIPRPRPRVTDRAGTLVLSSPSGETATSQLIIEENALGHAEVRYRAGYDAPVKLRELPTLQAAFRYADAIVQQRYADRLALLAKDAPWRRRPASERQLQLLAQLGTRVAPGISAGQASLLISLARALRIERASKLNEPATPGQLRYLRLLGVKASGPLTKREAGRLISEAKKRRASRRQPAPTRPS
jgi:ATP-dependent helicase IRC3